MRKIIKTVLFFFVVIAVNFMILKYCNFKPEMNFSFNVISDTPDTYQVFYCGDMDPVIWADSTIVDFQYNNPNEIQHFSVAMPIDTKYFRLDIGETAANIKLSDIELRTQFDYVKIDLIRLYDGRNQAQFGGDHISDTEMVFGINVLDPYMAYAISEEESAAIASGLKTVNLTVKILLCVILNSICVVFFKKYRSILSLGMELYHNRQLIWSLSKNDFKTRYAGSYLGLIWAFIQPIITVLVYWFVFQFGLKSTSPMEEMPFTLWFVAGIIPWFFFSEAITNATSCFIEYSYLVKKVVFKISILPMVKTISALFVHCVFVCFTIALFLFYKFPLGLGLIQVIYYSTCTFVLALAISFLTSAIIVFMKDLKEIINIILQIGMWATPIVWSYTIIPENYQWIAKVNPMFYVVEGFRSAFSNNGIWFWQHSFQTAYFWGFTFVVFVIGVVVFKKLKPHFADVL